MIYKTVDITVYDAESQQSIVIAEDGDGLAMVAVKQKGKDADYFGKLDFSMDADVAEAVANAILEQVKYIRETHK